MFLDEIVSNEIFGDSGDIDSNQYMYIINDIYVIINKLTVRFLIIKVMFVYTHTRFTFFIENSVLRFFFCLS